MDFLLDPLDDVERGELDRFLLHRGAVEVADNYVEGRDEGILTLSELDGFFTAIVSGPEEIVPSRWLPAVWGDVEPVWESTQVFERIVTLLSRYKHRIAASLLYSNGVFEPLFMEQEVEGVRHTIVHEWCMGYMRGIGLAQELWGRGGDEMLGLLMPIDIFTNDWGWKILERLNGEDKAVLKKEIAPAARAIHGYWLARRG